MSFGEVDFNDLFLPDDDTAVPNEWLDVLYIFFLVLMGVLVMNLLVRTRKTIETKKETIFSCLDSARCWRC